MDEAELATLDKRTRCTHTPGMEATTPNRPAYRYANVDAKPEPGDRVRAILANAAQPGELGTVIERSRRSPVACTVEWDNGRRYTERMRYLDRI